MKKYIHNVRFCTHNNTALCSYNALIICQNFICSHYGGNLNMHLELYKKYLFIVFLREKLLRFLCQCRGASHSFVIPKNTSRVF